MHPNAPRTVQITCTIILACFAVVAWIAALILIDIDVDRDLPDTVISGALALAVALSIIAAVSGFNDLAQRRLLHAIGVNLAAIKDDTGNIPRITDTLDEVPQFTEWVTLVDELGAKVNVIAERQAWLLRERGLLPPVQVVPESEDFEQIKKDIAMKSFETGRRIGRREAEG